MNILVVVNEHNGAAQDAAAMLSTYFASQGIAGIFIPAHDIPIGTRLVDVVDTRDGALDFDLAVVLGGDGTILRTARILAGKRTPIMGINFGHLGFLANVSDPGVIPMVAAALAGDVTAEERMNLSVHVVCEGDDEETIDAIETGELAELDGEERMFFALNEFALTRGGSGAIVTFDLSVSGDHVVSLRADGVVVSTATGSTAYALSAGGPLVAPSYRGLIIVPLAPHTLLSRAIVTAPHDIVELDIPQEYGNEEVSLFIDGEALSFAHPVKRVIIRQGAIATTLLDYRKEPFYSKISRVFFEAPSLE
ncbi:MAG: NAD(+)/NADH kinase [Eggerthellaceae bacterium]|nr:NAD(+)/NADH kinase [Eggerthellaceae bacterium]